MMHGMFGFGAIWMIIFWFVLIGMCVALIGSGIYLFTKLISGNNKHINNNREINYSQNKPLQTLQEQLAKGEIDEAEYERLKAIQNYDKS